MFCVFDSSAVRRRYGADNSDRIMTAVSALGTAVDVAGQNRDQIRARIEGLNRGAVCLIGGYDLLPPFVLTNPSAKFEDQPDLDIKTDAPYGARVGSDAEAYLPSRPVARLPDAGDADAFVALLGSAVGMTALPSGAQCFEVAAAEFRGAAEVVHGLINPNGTLALSPPYPQGSPPAPAPLAGCGVVHVLLHGARQQRDRATLWGRAEDGNPAFIPALSAPELLRSDLRGAIVLFGSCYAAMLDSFSAGDPPRNAADQVALACLAAGAKAVFACTRASWIDISASYDAFVTALIMRIWARMKNGAPAAEALRGAKWEYAEASLRADPGSLPYVLKTVLQMQCYGHPMAQL